MELACKVGPESRVYDAADHELALEALRSLPTALLVVRADGTTLLSNRRACAALERTRAEIEGASVASYLAPIDTLLRLGLHEAGSAKLSVTLPSDRDVTIGFNVSELRQLDALADEPAYAVILEDITETERLREERDRLLQIATVHEVLPSILHEVKNPLAAIATTAELLVEEAADENVRSSAHAILHEARRMKLTLQGIGSVGRALRSNRHQAVDHAIREACAVLSARAESLGVRGHCDVADMPLLPLETAVISALVFNLVTNAIQACPSGGEMELSARLEDEGRWLVIAVRDTGVGMTKDVLAHCRELFFTTKARGTGIGLALCQRAVTEAGGEMEIESAPGRGTRITLRIPIETPAESGVRP
ncbi:MAG: ATP-binding protein [Minicystis sp.]